MSYQSDIKKKQFLKLLKSNNGNIAQTCRDMDIPRQSYDYWRNTDSVFEDQLLNLKESLIDKAYENVSNSVFEGNLKSSYFVLTTLGKNRGFTTKSTIEAISKKDVVFSFEPVKDKKQLPAGPNQDQKIIDIETEDITE